MRVSGRPHPANRPRVSTHAASSSMVDGVPPSVMDWSSRSRRRRSVSSRAASCCSSTWSTWSPTIKWTRHRVSIYVSENPVGGVPKTSWMGIATDNAPHGLELRPGLLGEVLRAQASHRHPMQPLHGCDVAAVVRADARAAHQLHTQQPADRVFGQAVNREVE